jgi:hypothetical protein
VVVDHGGGLPLDEVGDVVAIEIEPARLSARVESRVERRDDFGQAVG